MKTAIVTLMNKKVGDIALNDNVFGVEIRKDILTRAVNWQRSRFQQGTHKTKGISEVSGTGKKPFRQKGTGNARAGSLRQPQRRGGAIIFGPTPRSHATEFPKKLRKLALKIALSAKAKEGKLVIVDALKSDSHKTIDMIAQLAKLDVKSALFVYEGELDMNFARSVNNIPYMDVLAQAGTNVYQILQHETLVLTKVAAEKLQERLA